MMKERKKIINDKICFDLQDFHTHERYFSMTCLQILMNVIIICNFDSSPLEKKKHLSMIHMRIYLKSSI